MTWAAEAVAKARAVSKPTPIVDPVIRIVLPAWELAGEEGSMAGYGVR